MKRLKSLFVLCLALSITASSAFALDNKQNDPSKPITADLRQVMEPQVSQEELVALLSQSLANSKILDDALHFENYTLGKKSLQKGVDIDQPRVYYEVTDGLRYTIDQLRKIADNTYTAEMAKKVKASIDQHFIVKNGKIYAYKGMANPETAPETVWDIYGAKILYQTDSKMAVLTNVDFVPPKEILKMDPKAPKSTFEGELMFKKENGKWRLASGTAGTNLPYSGFHAKTHQNERSYTREMLLDFVGKKENGYTLSEPISNFIPVIDPEAVFNGSGFDAPFDSYFRLSLCKMVDGELKEMHKIYVPQRLHQKILIAKEDAKGIRNLNYEKVVESQKVVSKNDEKALFAYRHFVGTQETENLQLDMRDSKYWVMEDEIRSFSTDDNSNEAILILPKYYNSTIEAYRIIGKTEKKLDIEESSYGLLIWTKDSAKKPIKIVVKHDGEEVVFEAKLDKNKKPVVAPRSIAVNYKVSQKKK